LTIIENSTTKASTTTTVTSSTAGGSSAFGQNVTFTATVSSVTPGAVTPTGTVQFQIDAMNTGVPVAVTDATASFSTSMLAVGTHTISALYSGDDNFLASSGSLTQTVLSAQQEIRQTSNQVNALVTTGILSSGNGNALTAKLNSATASLNAGNTS